MNDPHYTFAEIVSRVLVSLGAKIVYGLMAIIVLATVLYKLLA